MVGGGNRLPVVKGDAPAGGPGRLGDAVPAVIKLLPVKFAGGGLGHVPPAVPWVGSEVRPLQLRVPRLLRQGALGDGLLQGVGEGRHPLGLQRLQVVAGGHLRRNGVPGVIRQRKLHHLPAPLVQNPQGGHRGPPDPLYRIGQRLLGLGTLVPLHRPGVPLRLR